MAPSIQPSTAATTTSLQIEKSKTPQNLLEEIELSDPFIRQFNLTKTRDGSRAYAAALLAAAQQVPNDVTGNSNFHKNSPLIAVNERIGAVQAVLSHLLKDRECSRSLAGSFLNQYANNKGAGTASIHGSNLHERCGRLQRQGDLVSSIAQRVESTLLHRGLQPMERCTKKLGRLLELNRVLKQCLKLKFEMTKIRQLEHLFVETTNDFMLIDADLRDLVRVSSSVSVVEKLLDSDTLNGATTLEELDVVRRLVPEARRASTIVRTASKRLLESQLDSTTTNFNTLGSTLQVYFHLGELPNAVWEAVTKALNMAEKASSQLLNPGNMKRLRDSAKSTPKNKLMSEASSKWAAGVGDAAVQVLNLQMILSRKTDPVTRQRFIDVVSSAINAVPDKFQSTTSSALTFSLFDKFFESYSAILGARIQRLLKYENGTLVDDVAELYPSMRVAALSMLDRIAGAKQSAPILFTSARDGSTDEFFQKRGGIFGGSEFLSFDLEKIGLSGDYLLGPSFASSFEQSFSSGTIWSKPDFDDSIGNDSKMETNQSSPNNFSSLGEEWRVLKGFDGGSGLAPLSEAFANSSLKRLTSLVEKFFHDDISIDENGVTMVGTFPTIPSKFDLSLLESSIENETLCIDPNVEGFGNYELLQIICSNIVTVIEKFCDSASRASSIMVARKNARTKSISEFHYFDSSDRLTENFSHDLKLIGALTIVSKQLKNVPEIFSSSQRSKNYVAILPQMNDFHEKCKEFFTPALSAIYDTVKTCMLLPLCTSLCRILSRSLSKMHAGAYLEKREDESSFVERNINPVLENIASIHIAQLPNDYSAFIANRVCRYCINSFVSNVALIRPLEEESRLLVTQDLADIELGLEQFILHCGSTISLSSIGGGQPYKELRAMRNLLFWDNFRGNEKLSSEICRGLINEPWAMNLRTSTITNFLHSFAPTLLSSPHESKNIKIHEYVEKFLVPVDEYFEDDSGETTNWVITAGCCDAFRQRESALSSTNNEIGDKRVPDVLMQLGQELSRRKKL